MGKSIFILFSFVFLCAITENLLAAPGCPGNINEITFCDTKIQAVKCVRATNDTNARKLCGTTTYWNLSDSVKYGTNYPGYYLCSNSSPTQSTIAPGGICPKKEVTKEPLPAATYLSEICKSAGAVSTTPSEDNNNFCNCGGGAPGFSEQQANKGSRCNQNAKSTSNPELQALQECLNNLNYFSSNCSSQSSEASTKCDQTNKDNKEIDQAKAALSQTTQMMSMFKAGSGAVKECLTAGAAALASKTAMDALKEQCDESENKCSNGCDSNQFSNMTAQCYSSLESLKASPSYSEAYQLYQKSVSEASTAFTAGTKTCQVAKKKQSDMGNLLNDLMRTVQSSAACACQLSADGTSCNNPTASNGVLAVCAVGTTTYNAQACQCQMTQNADPSCRNLGTQAANPGNGFNGPAINSNLPSDFGASGSKDPSLNIGNLNDENAADPFADKKGNKDMAGFAPPGGGAAGGGGGGGGSSALPDSPAAEVHEDKPSGGLFGLAKNALNSLFGGTKPVTATKPNGVRGGIGQKGDFEKWRPNARGIASCDQRELGCANGQTIWQRVNKCSGNTKEKSTCNIMYLGPK